MDELLQEYREERKRARDRLYEARQLGANVWSFDLPDIPKTITQEDIDELREISKEILKQARDEAREDNEKYADDDDTAKVSILDELNTLITNLFQLVQGTEFLRKTNGVLITGNGGKGNVIYQDTDSDKADIINYWNDFFDEHTKTEEDARRLYIAINSKMGEISMLLNLIEFADYKVAEYRQHTAKLIDIFNYLGAPASFTQAVSKSYSELSELGDEG